MEAQHMRRFPVKAAGPPSPQTPRHCWAFEICDAVVLDGEPMKRAGPSILDQVSDSRMEPWKPASKVSGVMYMHSPRARSVAGRGPGQNYSGVDTLPAVSPSDKQRSRKKSFGPRERRS